MGEAREMATKSLPSAPASETAVQSQKRAWVSDASCGRGACVRRRPIGSVAAIAFVEKQLSEAAQLLLGA
jgi:hypothetical protein